MYKSRRRSTRARRSSKRAERRMSRKGSRRMSRKGSRRMSRKGSRRMSRQVERKVSRKSTRRARKVSRKKGKSPWLKHVNETLAELQKKDPNANLGMAMKAASKTYKSGKQE